MGAGDQRARDDDLAGRRGTGLVGRDREIGRRGVRRPGDRQVGRPAPGLCLLGEGERAGRRHVVPGRLQASLRLRHLGGGGGGGLEDGGDQAGRDDSREEEGPRAAAIARGLQVRAAGTLVGIEREPADRGRRHDAAAGGGREGERHPGRDGDGQGRLGHRGPDRHGERERGEERGAEVAHDDVVSSRGRDAAGGAIHTPGSVPSRNRNGH